MLFGLYRLMSLVIFVTPQAAHAALTNTGIMNTYTIVAPAVFFAVLTIPANTFLSVILRDAFVSRGEIVYNGNSGGDGTLAMEF
jgi:hypothetical protein